LYCNAYGLHTGQPHLLAAGHGRVCHCLAHLRRLLIKKANFQTTTNLPPQISKPIYGFSRYAAQLDQKRSLLTASSQANTSAFNKDPQGIADKLTDKLDKLGHKTDLLDALTGSASSKELEDFYKVGLWSYCSGKYEGGVEKYTYCSPSKTNFWFNPVDVWGLKNTSVQNVLGDDLQKGLDTYKKVSGWMNWAFIIATILTAAEFVIGFFAIFSRWGSFVVTIISTVSSPSSRAAPLD
jgi:hypothetical protein